MYYFARKDRRLRYGDRRLIKVGVTHIVECEPFLCRRGLHASKNILDALKYAPGPILCKVKLHGDVIHSNDKSVATHRTYLDMIDATDILKRFACLCALDVIHLWGASDVVVKYLKTGDENLRVKARDAAWSAAESAARDAAQSAAESAAQSAAESAAWSAAWNAAESAAQSAAESAAWSAAWNAAESAAQSAAESAAWSAAWSATCKKQERRLCTMVGHAFAKQRKELNCE